MAHGALTALSVGIFIQTWYKTKLKIHYKSIWLTFIPIPISAAIKNWLQDQLEELTQGWGDGTLPTNCMESTYWCNRFVSELLEINIFNNNRILVVMIVTLTWYGNLYRVAAHSWMWSTRTRHVALWQLVKSALPREKARRDRTKVTVNHKLCQGVAVSLLSIARGWLYIDIDIDFYQL